MFGLLRPNETCWLINSWILGLSFLSHTFTFETLVDFLDLIYLKVQCRKMPCSERTRCIMGLEMSFSCRALRTGELFDWRAMTAL